MIHICKQIKEVVEKKRVSITELAESINKSRTLVYNIFERESIDTNLLLKISEVLDFNFFKLFISHNEVNEDQAVYQVQSTKIKDLEDMLAKKVAELETALKEVEYLKKINKLLEEKNG